MSTEHWASLWLAATGTAAAIAKPLGALLDAIAHRIRVQTETTSYDQGAGSSVKAALALGWAEADTDAEKRNQIITVLSLHLPRPATDAPTLETHARRRSRKAPIPTCAIVHVTDVAMPRSTNESECSGGAADRQASRV